MVRLMLAFLFCSVSIFLAFYILHAMETEHQWNYGDFFLYATVHVLHLTVLLECMYDCSIRVNQSGFMFLQTLLG